MGKNRDPDSEAMTTGQVAQLLYVHPNTIRKWCRAGFIKSFRVGPRADRRFLRSDIEQIVAARR